MPNHDPDSPETPPSRTPIYDALPLKRRRFVDAYVAEPNAAAAARRAGHVAASPHVASVTGARILASASTTAAIAEVAALALEEAGWSAQRAIAALGHVAERPADYGGGASVAAAGRILDVALPREAATAQHLHVAVSAAQLRHVAQRLAAELGAPDALEA